MIGILGGTFDPVHYGHLRPALEIMQVLGLEQVRFIPNKVPPHRDQPWLDGVLRRQLVELAIADVAEFVLDERELQRQGLSYMVDTLEDLQREFPGQGLCLIMGMDAFTGFTHWHRWQAILELCNLVVMTRPGCPLPDFGEHQILIESRLLEQPEQLSPGHLGQILLQSVTLLDISASGIRHSLAAGRSIRYLVPEQVREILEDYASR
ncbi:MAG: nicotinate-nucleotide adenylyltransferase [Gammaproteobacteria bacterium]|nr:nicotinate-nucleotide adenylyltransferase [Gammaproteobacteria bacterium]